MTRSIIYILAILLLNSGCKKFIDVNQDPNRPIDVQEALILAPVEISIAHSIMSGSGGFAPQLSQHYMQTIALNQPVPNEGTYLLNNGNLDGDWSNIYVTNMNNLRNMNSKAEAAGNYNYAGIAKILTAFCLGTATDWWGDVPYSEAFQGSAKFTPKYDAQEDVYNTMQTLIDNGIADIGKAEGKIPGGDDYFYGGDMDKWKRFAYSLKARYYLHLTKAPGHTAQAQADLALQALQNGMQSNDDDLKFSYPGDAGLENQWFWVFDPVSTLILSAEFVDTLKIRNDPRLSYMVAPATETNLYTGRQIGTTGIGSLEEYSRPSAFYRGAGASTYIFTYSEALFLKAEALLRTSGYAAAQPVYKAAMESHFTKLGVDLNSTGAKSYFAARGTLTAENSLQRIIEEKFIANFLNMETWNDWRRTGYPAITKVPNASSDIPRRLLYPQSELTSNPQPQQSARLTDRVWWDAQ
jgi:hypothetical protein